MSLRRRKAPAVVEEKPEDADPQPPDDNKLSILLRKWDNVAWLCAAVGCFYYFQVPQTLIFDESLDRFYLTLSLAAALVFLSIGVYFVIYLYYIQRIDTEQWTKLYPTLFPIATGSFLAACIFFIFGVWPCWGVWSVPILVTQCMAVVVVITFF